MPVAIAHRVAPCASCGRTTVLLPGEERCRACEANFRPTEFRGCIWDDGWEFDAPCVIYYPWRYRSRAIGSNNGTLDRMVEDICWNICELAKSDQLRRDLNRDLDHEMAWRGWGRRFDRRRSAEHVVFRVRWTGDDYEIVERTETLGPPAKGEQR